jgi:hypothetical protein
MLLQLQLLHCAYVGLLCSSTTAHAGYLGVHFATLRLIYALLLTTAEAAGCRGKLMKVDPCSSCSAHAPVKI